MPWIWLLLAGAVEVAWAQSIKPTEGFTRLPQTALCLVLMLGAVYLLSRALQDLPVGTSYAVFTGIGTIGAVLTGLVLRHETPSPAALAGLALITTGLVTVHLGTTD
ncbi:MULTISPECIES: multidrug efflux SMR transporter [unclassified Streptomyces]|uniref:DMT family transporter n=1 Tax=Streptomycetaceae TaxID=2062 RepID=UPI002E779022|nr:MULTISPECIES: multidrug efflux SMR transporter [unclassified Streptomyces]MED7954238.1 multidrug efflux SMR transporter [Streptomyces sp. BE303]MEE1825720.1 multidrug efflux SMR transporter [Streptomyces sp. BE20]